MTGLPIISPCDFRGIIYYTEYGFKGDYVDYTNPMLRLCPLGKIILLILGIIVFFFIIYIILRKRKLQT